MSATTVLDIAVRAAERELPQGIVMCGICVRRMRLVGGEVHGIPKQMDDAGLNDCFGERGVDRLGEPFEPVDHGQQDILNAAVLEFVHHPQPEFGTLVLLDPHAQHHLGAAGNNTECNVNSLVANNAFIADLHANGIKENNRIDWIERTLLPSIDLFENRVGDRADQIR